MFILIIPIIPIIMEVLASAREKKQKDILIRKQKVSVVIDNILVYIYIF